MFASPFASALKRSHPQAKVRWLVEKGLEELISSNPHIDEVISWPKAQWRSLWKSKRYKELYKEVKSFSAMLKSKGFDCAIDLQGLLKSGMLAKMSGAPRRISLGGKEGSRYLMTEVYPKGGHIERVSSEYLYLAEQLGLDTGDFLPELYLATAAEDHARALLAEYGLKEGKYAVLVPFSTRPQKQWFNDAWRELIQRLSQHHHLRCIVLGGAGNVQEAEQIVAGLDGAVNFAGKTNLSQSAALVKLAGVLAGVDTGMTHAAIAFNTPAAILFGSTRPYLITGRENAKVIWLNLSCAPCGRRPTCQGAYTCMRDITAEMVEQKMTQVMQITQGK